MKCKTGVAIYKISLHKSILRQQVTLSVGLSVSRSVSLQKNLKIEKSRFNDYIVSACAMGPVVYFCNGRTCFLFSLISSTKHMVCVEFWRVNLT